MKNLATFDWIRQPDGSSLFEEFLNSLPEKDSAKLLSVVDQVQQKGIAESTKMQWVKKLQDGLYEIRSKLGSNDQRALYFHDRGSHYLITHGFTKKTNKTPIAEIERAQLIRRQYESEKRNERN
jgi:phage-related protein